MVDVLGSLCRLFAIDSPVNIDVWLFRDEVELCFSVPKVLQFSGVVGASVPTILDLLQWLFCEIGKGNPLHIDLL